MGHARPDPSHQRPRPRATVIGAALAVALGLHWLVLGGDAAGGSPATRPLEPVTVRTLEPPPVVESVPATPVVAPVAAVPARPLARSAARMEPQRAPAPVATASTEAQSAAVRPVADAASAPEPFPLYRAVLPPPARMHCEMKRGMVSGSGDLVWKPEGDRYELRLEASVAGLPVLTQVSTGSVGPHGVEPLRYTDERMRRGINAANFQRDKGKITYSGPQVEHDLPPGVQDRVSWMLQLGGVLNAEPQHATPGGRVVFFVSGARGDADTWTFRYVGIEEVSTSGGAIRAVKFTREPRQTYDRLVEIWLDPARRHLPVRARFSAEANGEVFELLLRDIQPP